MWSSSLDSKFEIDVPSSIPLNWKEIVEWTLKNACTIGVDGQKQIDTLKVYVRFIEDFNSAKLVNQSVESQTEIFFETFSSHFNVEYKKRKFCTSTATENEATLLQSNLQTVDAFQSTNSWEDCGTLIDGNIDINCGGDDENDEVPDAEFELSPSKRVELICKLLDEPGPLVAYHNNPNNSKKIMKLLNAVIQLPYGSVELKNVAQAAGCPRLFRNTRPRIQSRDDGDDMEVELLQLSKEVTVFHILTQVSLVRDVYKSARPEHKLILAKVLRTKLEPGSSWKNLSGEFKPLQECILIALNEFSSIIQFFPNKLVQLCDKETCSLVNAILCIENSGTDEVETDDIQDSSSEMGLLASGTEHFTSLFSSSLGELSGTEHFTSLGKVVNDPFDQFEYEEIMTVCDQTSVIDLVSRNTYFRKQYIEYAQRKQFDNLYAMLNYINNNLSGSRHDWKTSAEDGTHTYKVLGDIEDLVVNYLTEFENSVHSSTPANDGDDFILRQRRELDALFNIE